MANQSQIEFWNQLGGPRWVDENERLDRLCRPITEALAKLADVRPGHAVLDVGCGAGQTTLMWAGSAGATGRVVGMDVSAPLLAKAAARARAADAIVEWREADAQVYAFGDERFDRITSRFGVMFFEDPVAAFGNLRAALAAGGHMALAVWGPRQENGWAGLPLEALEGVADLPAPDPNAPGPFALDDAARLRGLLENAGLSQLTIEPCRCDLDYGTVDEASSFFQRFGPLAAAARTLEQNVMERAFAQLPAVVEQHATNGRLVLPSLTWLVRAEA